MSAPRCEFSGLLVSRCQAADLCDCFTDGRTIPGDSGLRPEAFTIGEQAE